MKQSAVHSVIQSLSKTLLEVMVIEFDFKGIHSSTHHHGRRELIPLSNDAIGKVGIKEQWSARLLELDNDKEAWRKDLVAMAARRGYTS